MDNIPIYITTLKAEVDGFGDDLLKNDLITFKVNINRLNSQENQVK
jgi:hypothetical protein